MTAAFRANLTILSGLALLVGVYLILQALEAAVVRRRPEIATLLALGVDANLIRLAWLAESATFGVVGSALGVLMGFGGAQLAVQGVARTVNALYLSTDASRATWHSGEALFAFAVGVGASLVAGVLPARDAAATPPAHVLKQGTHSPGIRLLDRPWQGLLFLAAGLLLIQLPPVAWSGKIRFPLAGYAGAICWLLGASVIVSAAFPHIARVLRPLGRRSAVVRIAISQFRRPSGRHKLTVAGLVIAVSMASGMSILIHSFEGTMKYWIQRNLKADLFVACKGVQNASNRNRIPAATWQAMAADPDIESVDVGHIHPIELDGAPTFLVGARLGHGWGEERFIWLQRRAGPPGLERPDPDGVWPSYVSESFHRRYRASLGDELRVPTPRGEQVVRIAAIFADYGNERGTMMVSAEQVVAWFDDASAINVAATVREGAEIESIRRRWQSAYPGLAVRTNSVLREEVLRIFRQTFSITYALKFIGVCVAVAGLILALVSLLIERRGELATLKELGMSSRQISSAVCLEGSGVALVGLFGGLILSFALGYVLIFVINRQSFGWTLDYAVSWPSTTLLSLAVLTAGVGTTWFVGGWASRLRGDQEE
jgi:putative ABC transport system permease protein